MKFSTILIVGLGGFLGATFRYIISNSTGRFFVDFPMGTLIVNVLGAFIMGFIMGVSANIWSISPNVKTFLTTGIMGGFTTFSTFSYETISLFSDRGYLIGGVNVVANIVGALVACWLGKILGEHI